MFPKRLIKLISIRFSVMHYTRCCPFKWNSKINRLEFSSVYSRWNFYGYAYYLTMFLTVLSYRLAKKTLFKQSNLLSIIDDESPQPSDTKGSFLIALDVVFLAIMSAVSGCLIVSIKYTDEILLLFNSLLDYDQELEGLCNKFFKNFIEKQLTNVLLYRKIRQKGSHPSQIQVYSVCN